MKKIILFIYAAAVSAFFSSAQQKTASGKLKFTSFNTIGLANGDNSVSAAIQSVNGFRKQRWFAGIGTGLDYYLYRSVPLFADVRREIGNRKNRFFAHAGAGVNIPWVPEGISWGDDKFKTGLYTDAGFGYTAEMKNGQAFILSLGHSIKTMEETRNFTDWRGVPSTTVFKYNFKRIMLKVGWRF